MRHLVVCRASSVSLLRSLQLSVENLPSLLHVVEVIQSETRKAGWQHARQGFLKAPDRSVVSWRLGKHIGTSGVP